MAIGTALRMAGPKLFQFLTKNVPKEELMLRLGMDALGGGMNDPEAIEATNNWMELFGQSNEGADFNATKTQQAQDQLYSDEKRGIE